MTPWWFSFTTSFISFFFFSFLYSNSYFCPLLSRVALHIHLISTFYLFYASFFSILLLLMLLRIPRLSFHWNKFYTKLQFKEFQLFFYFFLIRFYLFSSFFPFNLKHAIYWSCNQKTMYDNKLIKYTSFDPIPIIILTFNL